MSELEDDLLIIKSLIAICKGGLPLSKIGYQFRELEDRGIDFKKHGFTSLTSMLQSDGSISIRESPEGPKLFVNDEKMSHVTSLVSRQKVSKSTRKKAKNYGTHQYGRPRFNQQYGSSQRFSSGGSSQRYPSQHMPSSSGTNYKFSAQNQMQPRQQYQSTVSQSHQNLRPAAVPQSQPKFSQTSPTPASRPSSSDSGLGPQQSSSCSSWSTNSMSNTNKASVAPKQPTTSNPPKPSFANSSSAFDGKNQGWVHQKSSMANRVACSFGVGDFRLADQSSTSQLSTGNQNQSSNICKKIENQIAGPSQAKPSILGSPPSPSTPPLMSYGRGRIAAQPSQNTRPGPSVPNHLPVEKKTEPLAPNVLETLVNAVKKTSLKEDGVLVCPVEETRRDITMTTTNGLSSLVVTVDNNCLSDSDGWEDEFEPSLFDYQLLGDEVLLRMVECTMDCSITRTSDRSYCGLCVEGQSIEACRKEVEKNSSDGNTKFLSDQVMVMLGMTDILLGSPLNELKANMQRLLDTLQKYTSGVVLLTLPVFPCLANYPTVLSTVLAFNSWLYSIPRGLRHLWIIDIVPSLTSKNGVPRPECFERIPGLKEDRFTEEGSWAVMDTICSKIM